MSKSLAPRVKALEAQVALLAVAVYDALVKQIDRNNAEMAKTNLTVDPTSYTFDWKVNKFKTTKRTKKRKRK